MNRPGNTALFHRPLTRDEREDFLNLQAEIARLKTVSDRLIFVLGSYDDGKKVRLDRAQREIHSEAPGDYRARLMTEFLSEDDEELPGTLKFREIATQADALVGIAEDDNGGFVLEQGIITSNPAFFEKTFLLKRQYQDLLEHEHYSWMQATSLFDELERVDRIYRWRTEPEFDKALDTLITDVFEFID